MGITEKDVMECITDTSRLTAERQAANMGTALAAAKQADVLANNVEFWKWIGENYHCLGSADAIKAAAANNPQWLQRTVLQGKGYEWDFMTAQRQSFDKLFSRFDAGTSATQVGYDIKETSIITGKTKATYQNKAYTSKTSPHLDNTSKDTIVVTNKEQVANVQKQGYKTKEFQDSATIKKNTDKRMEQAKNGQAVGQYTIKNVAGTMAKAGAIGAVISMGTETIFSFKRMKNGEITPKEYLVEIGKSGLQGGITGAVSSGIMIPVQAGLTALGASALLSVPVAIVVGAALDKIIAPAFGRGDYAKQLGEAKYYASITEMYVPMLYAIESSAAYFDQFVDEIAEQQKQFAMIANENNQLNMLQSKGVEVLSDRSGINELNALIKNI
ncbi:MAG: hypothetical protein NC299_08340 [Lachnospiraceae bacterium]|nr:hypothetical protein [Ruminococcus sp.]MCM1275362.1 hypothetical protein [Lachnospiraceae bacterium]